jgi:hypothetical protein
MWLGENLQHKKRRECSNSKDTCYSTDETTAVRRHQEQAQGTPTKAVMQKPVETSVEGILFLTTVGTPQQ